MLTNHTYSELLVDDELDPLTCIMRVDQNWYLARLYQSSTNFWVSFSWQERKVKLKNNLSSQAFTLCV